MKKHKIITFILSLLLLFLLSACTKGVTTNEVKTAQQISDEINKITVQLINKKEIPQGTSYLIKLKNGSSFLIKQNSVYVSMPINLHNSGQADNKLKVEATGNKLNIKSGEEVTLNALIPIENYKGNVFLEQEHPRFEIKGYLNEVTEQNQFQKIEDLK